MKSVQINELLSMLNGNNPGAESKQPSAAATEQHEWIAATPETLKLKGCEITLVKEDTSITRVRISDSEGNTIIVTGTYGLKVLQPKPVEQTVWRVKADPFPGVYQPIDYILADEVSAHRFRDVLVEKGVPRDSISLDTEVMEGRALLTALGTQNRRPTVA